MIDGYVGGLVIGMDDGLVKFTVRVLSLIGGKLGLWMEYGNP